MAADTGGISDGQNDQGFCCGRLLGGDWLGHCVREPKMSLQTMVSAEQKLQEVS